MQSYIKIYTNEEKGIVKTNSTLNKIIVRGVVVRNRLPKPASKAW